MIGFRIGERLDGFCNGFFGRDCYAEKRVEAFGVDWVICRGTDGNPYFASFDDTDNYCGGKQFWDLVEEWRKGDSNVV